VRRELKYIIPESAFLSIKNRVGAVMKADSHSDSGAGYRVTSLYFDDTYRTAYYDKSAGLEKRGKFRIRAYNLEPSTLHFEIKGKDGEYVYKKAATITYEQYAAMIKGDYAFAKSPEFAGTAIEEFLVFDRLTRLRPRVITDYFRTAYVCEAGNVRITFDSKLSTSCGGFDMFKVRFSPVLSGVILEIKYDGFIPAHIADLFSGFRLYAEAASKFMMCSDKYTEVKKCAF